MGIMSFVISVPIPIPFPIPMPRFTNGRLEYGLTIKLKLKLK